MKREIVRAEFNDPKLTGLAAMQWFADQEGRELVNHANGTFGFVDGINIYKPLMTKTGWKIIIVDSDF